MSSVVLSSALGSTSLTTLSVGMPIAGGASVTGFGMPAKERRTSAPQVSTLNTLLDVETVIKVARALSQEVISCFFLIFAFLLVCSSFVAEKHVMLV